MWKFLVVMTIVFGLGEAQRSSYAPSSNSKLLARFKKNQTSTQLGTREGADDSTSTLPPELQGTLEDEKFVQRVSKWPEQRQPFWFKNRHAISTMRGREIDGGNINQRPENQFQSSFQGSSIRPSLSSSPVSEFQSPFQGSSRRASFSADPTQGAQFQSPFQGSSRRASFSGNPTSGSGFGSSQKNSDTARFSPQDFSDFFYGDYSENNFFRPYF